MIQDNNINITVTGKNEAGPALKEAGRSVEELRKQLDELRAQFRSLHDAKTGDLLPGMGDAASKIREEMAAVRRAIVEVENAAKGSADALAKFKGTGEDATKKVADGAEAAALKAKAIEENAVLATRALEATTGAGIALGTGVGLAIGAIVVAVGAAVLAVGALTAAMIVGLQAAQGWGEVVDTLQDLTGMSAQAASAFAYIGQVAGASAGAVESSLAMHGRLMQNATDSMVEQGKATNEAIQKYGEETTAAIAAQNERRTEDARAHAERLGNIGAAASAAAAAAADREAEREADRMRDQVQAVENQQQRMADLEERHTESLRAMAQSLADTQEANAQRAEDRAARLADRLESLDDRNADRRLSLQQRVAMARDEFEKKALEGQLADFDSTAAKERQKLIDKANADEARAKAEDDKRMARLQARIDAEEAAYLKQLARQQAAFEKAEREKAESYDRDTARIEKAQAAQAAATGARYAAEQASFERIEAAREKAAKAADDARTKALSAQLTKLRDSSPPVVKALEDIGIKFEDLKAMSPEEQFFAVATGINAIDDAHKKIDLLNKLYGRGGWRAMYDLIEVMGKKTWPEWQKATKDAGLELDNMTVDSLEEAERSANALKMQFEGMKVSLGVELLPVLQAFMSELQKFWKLHGPEIKNWLTLAVTTWIPNFIQAIERFGVVADKIANSPLFKVMAFFAKASMDVSNTFDSFGREFDRVFGTGQVTQSGSFANNLQAAGGLPSLTTNPGFVTLFTGSNGGTPTPLPGGSGSSGGGPNGPSINITNNYPSPPITKDESLRYYLYAMGMGGRQ